MKEIVISFFIPLQIIDRKVILVNEHSEKIDETSFFPSFIFVIGLSKRQRFR